MEFGCGAAGRRRMGARAFGLLALLAAAGCSSSGTDQALKTVTVQGPASRHSSRRRRFLPSLRETGQA